MIEPNPDATFDVVLIQHQQLPPADQPRFKFRVLRRRQTKELVSLLNRLQSITESTDPREGAAVMDGLETFVAGVMVGWENQRDEAGKPLAYDPADIDRLIDNADLIELALAIPRQSRLTAGERKKSDWQLRSSSAQPASIATPASQADAATSLATATL